MNVLLILVVSIIVLALGYVFYGGWLARQWGIDKNRTTPAYELTDGVDYVPAKPYVVLGHHFSSIAGAGPINGPIQAAIFGWVPVILWVLIGGIFFGAVHDFGSLFASLRHKGQTLSAVIAINIDETAKKLFCVFAYLTLVLVVAAFSSIVASTFASTAEARSVVNEQTASVSILFIIGAIIYGMVTRGRNIPGPVNIAGSIIFILVLVVIGYNFHPIMLDYRTWMVLLGIYILVASVAPVWILLQPRDYLSSYLLYGMIILALVAVVGSALSGHTGDAAQVPAFTGFTVTKGMEVGGLVNESKVAVTGYLFPALFITIACGAISGFHSLVGSGTSSKQLQSEAHAQPIAFGSMLLECLVAVLSLAAVGFVWTQYLDGTFTAPTAVFANGLSSMLDTIPGLAGAGSFVYSLLILAVSVFCLTSLDTATRLARYLFQALFTPKDMSPTETTGWRRVLTNPWLATAITVVVGVALGLAGYQLIWPLFGAANQLLAFLGLLAVAAWLGNAGRNNKMFLLPMAFMLVVTVTSLILTIIAKVQALAVEVTLANVLQLVIGTLLVILAIAVAVKGARVIAASLKRKTPPVETA